MKSDFIEKIYLDHQQCETFGVEYFEECSLAISCRDLQKSKSYDSAHTKIFDAYPDEILHLVRQETYAPGWYSWALF